MRIRDFIKQNRREIDQCIWSVMYRYDGKGGRGTIPDEPLKLTNKDRHEWILNEESLYRWARSCGVKI